MFIMDITEEMTDLRAKKKRPYRISDCVLFKACKEYFHEEEHSKVCDKYTQFICDQANADDETSKKIAQAINIEPLLLNLFLNKSIGAECSFLCTHWRINAIRKSTKAIKTTL